MSVALSLAPNGRGAVEPNPMVGAVIVRDGREIARGWHRRFGGPHAEIEALTAAREADFDVRGSTMYVTLEPCCHFGKTPPCTDAIIGAGIGRVVVAMQDVDPRVAGKGIAQLRAAGIEVTTGVCEAQARELLAPYIKLRTTGRPWVICKWAQTADGYIALPSGDKRRWISCEESRLRVHVLRGLCDGILVGVGTVLADDPLLTNRSLRGKQPCRVVLDANLRTPPKSRLARTAAESPVIVVACEAAIAARPEAAESLRGAGVGLLPVDRVSAAKEPMIDLPALLDELGRRQWTYLLVEGGAKVLASFISAGLADEIQVYISPDTAGASSTESLPRFDIADVERNSSLRKAEEGACGRDRWVRYLVGRI